MKLHALLSALTERGVKLSADGESLAVDAPPGTISPELRAALVENKAALLSILREPRGREIEPQPELVHRPEERHEPFPMTEIQEAYSVGRTAALELNAAMHAYNEIESDHLDVARLEVAWNRVVARHEMLRAVALPGFQQRILAEVPRYRIPVEDLTGKDPEEVEARLSAIRERLTHQILPLDRFPLFELRACRLDGGRTRLFMSIDGTFVDGYSFQILYRELVQSYKHPEAELRPAKLELSYRDYALAVHQLRGGRGQARALAYWRARLPALPPAPDLPLASTTSARERPRFRRWLDRLDAEVWQGARQKARRRGLTEPELLLAAYAEIIARWSRSPRFTINVPHFNRLPLHPQMSDIIGTFASFTLVEANHRTNQSFTRRALAIREEMLLALEHREVGGVVLLRELFKAQGKISGALMPIVMTSFASHAGDSHWVDFLADELGSLVGALTQTPQVWIDQQVVYQRGGVFLNWDVAEELFPPGMIDAMFGALGALLRRLAVDDDAWDEVGLDTLPAEQRRQIAAVNDTDHLLGGSLLHSGFYRQAAAAPDAVALASPGVSLSYAELSRRANRLAHALRGLGAGPGRRVAIVMDKGWEQVVSVIGVLAAGAAYVPIDADAPAERRAFLLEDSGADLVLTQPWLAEEPFSARRVLALRPDSFLDQRDDPPSQLQRPDELAHILYTSGSTGRPNGAMLTHEGMVNAVEWTNRRFGVGPDDRVIALSALHHDFSVYDIFGTLAAGGTIVLPDAASRRDPSRWAELMAREGVTVWSTVPAMMEMLLTFLEGGPSRLSCPLRLVMLGGDWIPVTMPARVRAELGGARVVSVGGPTETSLWNITHPVAPGDERRRSIPYGKPIANTRYYVLDEQLEERPVWVPGELCCAGVGVARGYVGGGAASDRFTVHPRTGERLYRTGDLGRYLPDGTLEFLGRIDFQLSIRGQRIEPGEIESALLALPGISAAVVSAVGEHHDKKLVAYVVPADRAIGVDVGLAREHLARKLPAHMVPSSFVVLDALPLTRNAKVDRRALPPPQEAPSPRGRPSLHPNAPPDAGDGRALERVLKSLVEEVLGVADVHPDTNFFELGANSVHLVALHLKIVEALGIKIPVVDLFGNPTVRYLAAHLEAAPIAPIAPSARARAGASSAQSDEDRDVAIIGMSCRFPGAATPDELWQNLIAGVESISTFRDDEIMAAGVSPAALRDPRYVRKAAVLSDVDRFDADFFSLSPREARALDPQQRVFLECAWEALEDAGYPPDACGALVGVYAGKSVSHYRYPYPDLTRPIHFFQDLISLDKDFLSTQVSYKLDLRGPSINVQTACSTSLVAVVSACEGLLQGNCEVALAGGVAIKVPHRVGYLYEEGSIFSDDGRCRPFDARARGTVPGSGAGVVVLKRLSRARADGDRVLAVIKGGCVNNDGHRKVGFMAPGVDGQAEVIRTALHRAGVDPRTISYVEAHGTGTALGDSIELSALTRVFGGEGPPRSCGLGSVKSNLGHLDSAAGVAGLIKTVLSLQHRTLPPSLHDGAPNPEIDGRKGPFYLVTEVEPWRTSGGPRRAGVSSFGIGGTNAHVVLEEAPEPERESVAARLERPRHLLALSARSDAALRALAGRYRALLEEPGPALADVCFSANTGRSRFQERLAVVGADREEIASLLGAAERGEPRPGLARAAVDSRPPPRVAFLFSGQGSQYTGVARDLYEIHPGFRRRLEGFDEMLRAYWDRSLLSVLYPAPGEPSPIDQFDYAQPALFALQYALAELWISFGVEPSALVGHSTGELAAACVAGVLGVEDGLKLAVHRGRLMHEGSPPGGNLAVFATAAELRAVTDEGRWDLAVAAINGPDNQVLSGSDGDLDALERALSARGIKARRLNIPRAAHSPLVDPILPELRAVAATLRPSLPSRALISGMTGELVTEEILAPDYWCRQIRSPVRFADAVATLLRRGTEAFVEIGPKSTLLGMAARCAPEDHGLWLPSLRPEDGGWRQLLESLAALFVRGARVDLRAFDAGYLRRKVPVPTYPFQRRRYWEEGAGLQRPREQETSEEIHPLLGRRIRPAVLGSGDLLFEATLGPSAPGFVGQHRVFDTPTLPATAFVEMALAAGAALLGEGEGIGLRDLVIVAALTFPDDAARRVQCATHRVGDFEAEVRIWSRPPEDVDGPWTVHATATVARHRGAAGAAAGPGLDRLRETVTGPIPVEEIYGRAARHGVDFGPAFRGIVELHRRGEEALGRVERPASLAGEGAYRGHPALLDACLQVVGAVYPDPGAPTLHVPASMASVVLSGALDGVLWSHAVVRPKEGARGRLRADVRVFGADGSLRAEVQGLELQEVDRDAMIGEAALRDDVLYERRWEPAPPPPAESALDAKSGGACLIFADRAGLGRRLAEALTRGGQTCFLVYQGAALRRIEERVFEAPSEPPALAEALRGMSLPALLVDAIHLWALDDADSAALGTAELFQATSRACGGVLGLLQHLSARGYVGTLWLVTCGAQPASSPRGADGPGAPLRGIAGAPLWGMARPIAVESSEIDCRCVDLDPEGTREGQALSLLTEIRGRAAVGEDQVAIRGGRLVARLRRATRSAILPAAPEGTALVRPDRSYLIAGGLGRLGLVTASFLARRGARHLVLIGRSPPSPEAASALAQLTALGARVRHEQVDVADLGQLTALVGSIEREEAELGGVFHGAGVLDDGVLQQQTQERFDRVLRPKVAGAWNLHLLTAERRLDHFVLFSSVASLLGSAGQANHCAATAFLDALAHHRRALGLAGLSINWGVWAGDAGARVEVSERARTRGFGVLSKQQGLRALQSLLGSTVVQMGVAPLDWSELTAGRPRPYLAELARGEPGGAAAAGAGRGAFLEKLERAPIRRRRALLLEYLREQVAWMRGQSASEAIDPGLGFHELGIDSLAALQLKNRVQQGLGVSLPATVVFNYPTIDQLAAHLIAGIIPLAFEEGDAAGKDAGAADEPGGAARPLDHLVEEEIADLLRDQLAKMV